MNFVRSQDLLQYIQEWNGSVDPAETIRALLHVGDITNCYHEMNHAGCLNGVAWGLSKMRVMRQTRRQWHHPTDRSRQTINRYIYSVGRFSRKAITVGADLTSERIRIALSTEQIFSVCEFDICNSILCIESDGELWKPPLGAPLGGVLIVYISVLIYVERCLFGTQDLVCHAYSPRWVYQDLLVSNDTWMTLSS